MSSLNAQIDLAFAALRKQGLYARKKFTCCGTCGCAAMHQQLERAGGKRTGYVFYHAQDAELLGKKGVLYLAYGGHAGRSDESVAQAVVDAFRAVGAKVDWNGNAGYRVVVGANVEGR